jgi:hypothetical protein
MSTTTDYKDKDIKDGKTESAQSSVEYRTHAGAPVHERPDDLSSDDSCLTERELRLWRYNLRRYEALKTKIYNDEVNTRSKQRRPAHTGLAPVLADLEVKSDSGLDNTGCRTRDVYRRARTPGRKPSRRFTTGVIDDAMVDTTQSCPALDSSAAIKEPSLLHDISHTTTNNIPNNNTDFLYNSSPPRRPARAAMTESATMENVLQCQAQSDSAMPTDAPRVDTSTITNTPLFVNNTNASVEQTSPSLIRPITHMSTEEWSAASNTTSHDDRTGTTSAQSTDNTCSDHETHASHRMAGTSQDDAMHAQERRMSVDVEEFYQQCIKELSELSLNSGLTSQQMLTKIDALHLRLQANHKLFSPAAMEDLMNTIARAEEDLYNRVPAALTPQRLDCLNNSLMMRDVLQTGRHDNDQAQAMHRQPGPRTMQETADVGRPDERDHSYPPSQRSDSAGSTTQSEGDPMVQSRSRMNTINEMTDVPQGATVASVPPTPFTGTMRSPSVDAPIYQIRRMPELAFDPAVLTSENRIALKRIIDQVDAMELIALLVNSSNPNHLMSVIIRDPSTVHLLFQSTVEVPYNRSSERKPHVTFRPSVDHEGTPYNYSTSVYASFGDGSSPVSPPYSLTSREPSVARSLPSDHEGGNSNASHVVPVPTGSAPSLSSSQLLNTSSQYVISNNIKLNRQDQTGPETSGNIPSVKHIHNKDPKLSAMNSPNNLNIRDHSTTQSYTTDIKSGGHQFGVDQNGVGTLPVKTDLMPTTTQFSTRAYENESNNHIDTARPRRDHSITNGNPNVECYGHDSNMIHTMPINFRSNQTVTSISTRQ